MGHPSKESGVWATPSTQDLDSGGEVEIDEFLMGCLRLRGNARAVDAPGQRSSFCQFFCETRYLVTIFQAPDMGLRMTLIRLLPQV